MQLMKYVLILLALVATLLAHAKEETCSLNLRLIDKDGNKSCLKNYSFSNIVTKDKNKSIAEIVKQYSCYSIAVSSSNECYSIAISTQGSSHCTQTIAEVMRDEDALSICRKSGCECNLLISNGKIIDSKILSNLEKNIKTIAENEENNKILLAQEKDINHIKKLELKILGSNEQVVQPKNESETLKVEKKAATAATNNKDTEIISKTLFISATATNPDEDGVFNINIQLDPKTASLKLTTNQFN